MSKTICRQQNWVVYSWDSWGSKLTCLDSHPTSMFVTSCIISDKLPSLEQNLTFDDFCSHSVKFQYICFWLNNAEEIYCIWVQNLLLHSRRSYINVMEDAILNWISYQSVLLHIYLQKSHNVRSQWIERETNLQFYIILKHTLCSQD